MELSETLTESLLYIPIVHELFCMISNVGVEGIKLMGIAHNFSISSSSSKVDCGHRILSKVALKLAYYCLDR